MDSQGMQGEKQQATLMGTGSLRDIVRVEATGSS